MTRKVSKAVAAITLGLQDELVMGNLDARRDWGFAGDYVEAMWLMLQQPEADDYVIATGETHSIEELLAARLRATSASTTGAATSARTRASCGRPRSTCSSATPPRRATVLGWKPEVGFEELVAMMVDADLAALKAGW